MRRPTINDIARLAGVSKKTVSRVINDSPAVRGATREKIQAVIADQGYVPDPQARALSLGRPFLVAVAVGDPPPQGLAEFQLGLLEGLEGSGLEVLVRRVAARADAALSGMADDPRLKGLVLVGDLASADLSDGTTRVLKAPAESLGRELGLATAAALLAGT